MGKLVVSEFITVDGVIDGPGGDPNFDRAGWSFQFERGEEGDQFKLDELMAAGALLLGRLTYDAFAGAWPNMTDEAGFADKMNGLPKYVVSTTLTNPTWNNTTVVSTDDIGRLKRESNGDLLVYGSSQLVQALAEHDLVDEYRLMVFPIIVGAGKKLFADTSHTAALRLVSSRTVGSDGVTILTYQPAGKED